MDVNSFIASMKIASYTFQKMHHCLDVFGYLNGISFGGSIASIGSRSGIVVAMHSSQLGWTFELEFFFLQSLRIEAS